MNRWALLLITGGVRRVFQTVGSPFGVVADGVGGVFLRVGLAFERIFASVFLGRIAGNGSKAEKGGPEKGDNGFHLYIWVCLIRFVRWGSCIAMTVPRRFPAQKKRETAPLRANRPTLKPVSGVSPDR